MHMPAQRQPATVTLRKGVVPSTSLTALFGWINAIQINQINKQDIYVRLCDEEGTAVLSWKVINAFPTKLDAPTFDANSNDVAIESMELMGDGIIIEAT
jgi:phage tail-like protein